MPLLSGKCLEIKVLEETGHDPTFAMQENMLFEGPLPN